MIKKNSENREIKPDFRDTTNFANYPQKKINKISSKNDIKIRKTTILKDDNSIDEICHNYFDPMFTNFLTADRIDILIIKELLQEPNIPTLEISLKINFPLYLVHKKRKIIEASILTKKYLVDLTKLGLEIRFVDIYTEIKKDQVNNFARELYRGPLGKNILSLNRVKNGSNGICIKAVYKNSSELFFFMDTIMSNPVISNIHFSELIEVLEDNTSAVILNLLTKD
ncbi:MAG: Lrp/AsnC family transcriptional regulator [Candidatus Nitrosocosmicus sp.]|nr:Lrp/AsnC family transcriptional regulator [Candidatus Nitrosocosmicus sp.]